VDVETISVTVVSDPGELVVSPDEDVAALLSGVVIDGVEIMTVVDDGISVEEEGDSRDEDEDAAAVDSLTGLVFVCSHRVQMVEVLVIMTVLVVTPTLVLVTEPEV
jgi:hypothetical protein